MIFFIASIDISYHKARMLTRNFIWQKDIYSENDVFDLIL